MRCSVAKNDPKHRCTGEVKEVIVYDKEADNYWGKWCYCRQAFLVDSAAGLTVIGYENENTDIDEQYKKFRTRNLKLKQRQRTK